MKAFPEEHSHPQPVSLEALPSGLPEGSRGSEGARGRPLVASVLAPSPQIPAGPALLSPCTGTHSLGLKAAAGKVLSDSEMPWWLF